jgi:hypothetical protein
MTGHTETTCAGIMHTDARGISHTDAVGEIPIGFVRLFGNMETPPVIGDIMNPA